MQTQADPKKKALAPGKARAAYAALKDEMRAGDVLLEARLKSGLTQAQVAARMGTSLLGVQKLEASLNQTKPSPTIATLRKYAAAIGKKLDIRLV